MHPMFGLLMGSHTIEYFGLALKEVSRHLLLFCCAKAQQGQTCLLLLDGRLCLPRLSEHFIWHGYANMVPSSLTGAQVGQHTLRLKKLCQGPICSPAAARQRQSWQLSLPVAQYQGQCKDAMYTVCLGAPASLLQLLSIDLGSLCGFHQQGF